MRKNIFAQLNSDSKNNNHSQLHLDNQRANQLPTGESPQNPAPSAKLFRQKPQIVNIPGVLLKEQHRYRVVLDDEVLGDRLTIEQAIALSNQSTHL